jgi:hypothetical protein
MMNSSNPSLGCFTSIIYLFHDFAEFGEILSMLILARSWFPGHPKHDFYLIFGRVRSSVISAVPVSLSKSFAISSFVQGKNLIRSTQNWQPCERAIDLLILWPVHYVHFVTQCANYTLQMHNNDRLSPAQSMLSSMHCNIVVLDYHWANQWLKSAGWNCKEKKNSGKNGCGFVPLHSASRISCSWFKY